MSIIKDFFIKNAAKFGMRNMPEDQKAMMMNMIEKNPGLFEKIAKETKDLVDAGKPEMYATFEIMQKYQKEMQEILKGEDQNKLREIANTVMSEDGK